MTYYNIKSVVYELDMGAGAEIRQTIKVAIGFAVKENVRLYRDEPERTRQYVPRDRAEVHFDFNGVRLRVRQDSDIDLILRDWDRALQGWMPGKDVGPHPAPVLTESDLAYEAVAKAEQRLRDEAREAERRELVQSREVAFTKEMTGAPAFAFQRVEGSTAKAEALWSTGLANNTDSYGGAVYKFAETWGRLMQKYVDQGVPLAECKDRTCDVADHHAGGITGYMFGAAVHVLARTWVHGRNWPAHGRMLRLQARQLIKNSRWPPPAPTRSLARSRPRTRG